MKSLLHHDRAVVERAVAFHGGLCPALALGIQAARVALEEVGPDGRDHEVHAESEDGTCGVDAVQALTGCTLGNRDLTILPYGKFAFTFHRRADGKSVRIVALPSVWDWEPEHVELFARVQAGLATPDQLERFRGLHTRRAETILDTPPRDLFTVTEVGTVPPVRPYSHRPTIICAGCGEIVASDRVRQIDDRAYCLSCARTR